MFVLSILIAIASTVALVTPSDEVLNNTMTPVPGFPIPLVSDRIYLNSDMVMFT